MLAKQTLIKVHFNELISSLLLKVIFSSIFILMHSFFYYLGGYSGQTLGLRPQEYLPTVVRPAAPLQNPPDSLASSKTLTIRGRPRPGHLQAKDALSPLELGKKDDLMLDKVPLSILFIINAYFLDLFEKTAPLLLRFP
jgi:hypothetical protein